VLIREAPATEIAVATRILARAGALAPDGRVALRVGTDVVYLAGAGVSPHTITPFDVAAVRIGDGFTLQGTPPADAGRYLAALRSSPEARAVVAVANETLVTAASLAEGVERVLGRPFAEATAEARAAGALIGAFPPSE
jgi:hypothetical protein